jgi:hypothetical protein
MQLLIILSLLQPSESLNHPKSEGAVCYPKQNQQHRMRKQNSRKHYEY